MRHPTGLGLLLFVELWERFSYYGMRSLLMLYMVQQQHWSVASAGQIYGLYTGLAYLLPIVGGALADRRMGQRWAIGLGSLLMALGHFALVFEAQWAFFAGLGLLVVGTGLFKANTATMVGKLYADGDSRRDAGFQLFYLTVNIGAFLAPLVCGSLAGQGQWHRGFAAAGVGMLIGLLAWVSNSRCLGELGQPVARPPVPVAKRPLVPALTPLERRRFWGIVYLALLGNISLWAAIGQAGSSMALFAARDTNLMLPWVHRHLPASYFQAANPLFIMLGIPLVGAGWRLYARRWPMPSVAGQFATGLLLVSAGFATLAVAGFRADAGNKVSMAWLLVATLLNTCGELCVSPVGLSLVSKYAPKRYTSAVMGLWYASIALANWISGQLAGLYDALSKAALFTLPSMWAAVMAVVLLLSAKKLQRMLQSDEPQNVG